MKDSTNIFIVGAMILFALLVFIVEPLIVIWCLKRLFHFYIMPGFGAWFAVAFLQGVLFGGHKLSFFKKG